MIFLPREVQERMNVVLQGWLFKASTTNDEYRSGQADIETMIEGILADLAAYASFHGIPWDRVVRFGTERAEKGVFTGIPAKEAPRPPKEEPPKTDPPKEERRKTDPGQIDFEDLATVVKVMLGPSVKKFIATAKEMVDEVQAEFQKKSK